MLTMFISLTNRVNTHLSDLILDVMKPIFWVKMDLEDFAMEKGRGSGPMEQNTKDSGSQELCKVLADILRHAAKSNMRYLNKIYIYR